MGTYDYLKIPGREGRAQVKLWSREFETFCLGDRVPSGPLANSYSVALREGGYANIHKGVFVSVTPKPEQAKVVDKYGDDFNPDNWSNGLTAGERYFFQ